MSSIESYVRDIPDFPKPGIVFKDLTPLLADANALAETTRLLAEPFKDTGITAVAGMEARGFIFGSLVAHQLGTGFIPLRKPGKLPASTHSAAYTLEYGEAELHMHTDAVGNTDKVLLVDDLIATGGTAAASIELVGKSGAQIAACAFVIELDFLNGREALGDCPAHSLLHF